MRILNSVAAIVLALGVEFPSLTGAQPRQPAPWNITFFGRVEAVNSESKVVTVKHGAIAGYMDSANRVLNQRRGAADPVASRDEIERQIIRVNSRANG
jgi:hypothetical protein